MLLLENVLSQISCRRTGSVWQDTRQAIAFCKLRFRNMLRGVVTHLQARSNEKET